MTNVIYIYIYIYIYIISNVIKSKIIIKIKIINGNIKFSNFNFNSYYICLKYFQDFKSLISFYS